MIGDINTGNQVADKTPNGVDICLRRTVRSALVRRGASGPVAFHKRATRPGVDVADIQERVPH